MKLLVFQRPLMPVGVLRFCLEYAGGDGAYGGVFAAIKENFADLDGSGLGEMVNSQYDFRNEYVAHVDNEPLTDRGIAEDALRSWIKLLCELSTVT